MSKRELMSQTEMGAVKLLEDYILELPDDLILALKNVINAMPEDRE